MDDINPQNFLPTKSTTNLSTLKANSKQKQTFLPLFTAIMLLSLSMLSACGGSNSEHTPPETIALDTNAPVITLNGATVMNHNYGDTYTDLGASATDNVDGSVAVITSGSVTINMINSYIITYTATDAAGNSSSIERTVYVVDKAAPVITLNGEAVINHDYGDIYTDLGASATDNVDGSVTVVTSGNVTVDMINNYTITYTATDAAGNSGSIERTVNVVEKVVCREYPAIMNKDGGKYYTEWITEWGTQYLTTTFSNSTEQIDRQYESMESFVLDESIESFTREPDEFRVMNYLSYVANFINVGTAIPIATNNSFSDGLLVMSESSKWDMGAAVFQKSTSWTDHDDKGRVMLGELSVAEWGVPSCENISIELTYDDEARSILKSHQVTPQSIIHKSNSQYCRSRVVKSYYDEYRTIYKVEHWYDVEEPVGPAHEVDLSEIEYLATDVVCVSIPSE